MQKRSSHVISFCKNLFIPKFPLKTVAPEASRENSLLTSTNHYFYAQQYMMLTRDARRSQSDFSFSFTKKQSENTTSQWPTKRPREDPEETAPAIIVNQASTATITEVSVNRNQNFLTASPVTITTRWISTETQPP